ncbi:MAG: SpoIIE family protein phosphatase, partial [Chloroflexota bacterium]
MLSMLLRTHRAHVAMMAEAWLTAGATTFTIIEGGTVLKQWPADVSPASDQIFASIKVGQRVIGELRLSGMIAAKDQSRLGVDADFFSRLISYEIELEQMTAELIDHQDQTLALYDLNKSTRTQLGLDELLSSLSQEALRLTKAAGTFVTLNTSYQSIVVEQHPKAWLDTASLQDFFKQTQLVGHKELLLHNEQAPEFIPEGVSTLFLKPIQVRNKTTAILGFLLNQPPASLSPILKLARAIAEYAGGQIENAILHQETLNQARWKTELDLAAQIQLRLLPRTPPSIEGLDIAASSRPALQVGGDFYDFIVELGGPLMFALGDVSGKGVSAAMLMAMTRTVIRSKTKSAPPPSPEAILSYSTEVMYDDFTEVEMFVTIVVGCYDADNHQIIYANAG